MANTTDFIKNLIPTIYQDAPGVIELTERHLKEHFPNLNHAEPPTEEVRTSMEAAIIAHLDTQNDDDDEALSPTPRPLPIGVPRTHRAEEPFGNGDNTKLPHIINMFKLLIPNLAIHYSRGVKIILAERTLPTTSNVYFTHLRDLCGPPLDEECVGPAFRLTGLRRKLETLGFTDDEPILISCSSLHMTAVGTADTKPTAFRPYLRTKSEFAQGLASNDFTKIRTSINLVGIFEWLINNPHEATGAPPTASRDGVMSLLAAFLRKTPNIRFLAALAEASCLLRDLLEASRLEMERLGATVDSAVSRMKTHGLTSLTLPGLDQRHTLDLTPHVRTLLCFVSQIDNPDRAKVEFENFFDGAKGKVRHSAMGYLFSSGLHRSAGKTRTFFFNNSVNANSLFIFADLELTTEQEETRKRRRTDQHRHSGMTAATANSAGPSGAATHATTATPATPAAPTMHAAPIMPAAPAMTNMGGLPAAPAVHIGTAPAPAYGPLAVFNNPITAMQHPSMIMMMQQMLNAMAARPNGQ